MTDSGHNVISMEFQRSNRRCFLGELDQRQYPYPTLKVWLCKFRPFLSEFAFVGGEKQHFGQVSKELCSLYRFMCYVTRGGFPVRYP